ncbi:hypothetical protein [Francisella sp. SYW-2]|nr:hypothetical protein [Francisella sp. SYW-2]
MKKLSCTENNAIKRLYDFLQYAINLHYKNKTVYNFVTVLMICKQY